MRPEFTSDIQSLLMNIEESKSPISRGFFGVDRRESSNGSVVTPLMRNPEYSGRIGVKSNFRMGHANLGADNSNIQKGKQQNFKSFDIYNYRYGQSCLYNQKDR
jgi:hypothetical protein